MNTKNTKRTLNAKTIVDMAMNIADADGYEVLSMRLLAKKLNVTAMSVYNHVENKDALLDLMLARVVSEFEKSDSNMNWVDAMRLRAHSMRQAFLRHRWAPVLLISKISLSDEIMKDLNECLACLVSSGFSYGEADWARNAIDSHVYGYTIQEMNYPVEPHAYKDAAKQFIPMISKINYPYLYASAQEIIQDRYDGITQFDFGLEIVLEGIEKWKREK